MKKKSSIWKYFMSRDTFFATISVFVVMGLLYLIPLNTHILDPFKLALRDFSYNDLVYNKLGKNKDASTDTNIVVVNIGKADRREIAALTEVIISKSPKVVGLDVLFKDPKDQQTDAHWDTLFSQNTALVMAYYLKTPDKGTMKPEGYFYNKSSVKGFANFVGEEQGVIRYVKPTVTNGGKYDSFSAAVLKVAAPDAYAAFTSGKRPFEIINYTRNADKFVVIPASEVPNIDPHVFKNKIVLLGYVAEGVYDIEDKHYTPFNPSITGRGVPDMNGIFIHANIIGMALESKYIQQTPAWLNWVIAFIICWICMAFFIHYYMEAHIWFHLVAKVVQLLMAVVFVYLGLLTFNKFDTQINMTATLSATILAVDVLYFYQSFAVWMHKKFKYKTILYHEAH